MEYLFDFSKEGEKRFYSWAKNKKDEINNLIKDYDENIEIYEKERISQINLVIEMVKKHNYSPKEAFEFIKKIKMQKLNELYNGSPQIKDLTSKN